MTTLPPPGRHGGDGARLAKALSLSPEQVLDLSASLNPVAPDAEVIVRRHLGAISRYPDDGGATAALAETIGVPADRLLLTNGGAEAIQLVAGELGGRVAEPEFSLLPRDGGPLWRSDPNNPTGVLAGPGEVADVWDEAFYSLATGQWTAGRSTVALGSLTKLFACPGLRLGYVLAPPGSDGLMLLDRLRAKQPRWAVNGLALGALPEFLAVADLPRWSSEIAELRTALVAVLEEFGLGPQHSDANFVLCSTARGLRDRLAPQAVLVRDCASFGLLDHARVAVPDERGLEQLTAALDASA